jgi:hypothetical protein
VSAPLFENETGLGSALITADVSAAVDWAQLVLIRAKKQKTNAHQLEGLLMIRGSLSPIARAGKVPARVGVCIILVPNAYSFLA